MEKKITGNYDSLQPSGFIYSFAEEPVNGINSIDFGKIAKENTQKLSSGPNNSYSNTFLINMNQKFEQRQNNTNHQNFQEIPPMPPIQPRQAHSSKNSPNKSNDNPGEILSFLDDDSDFDFDNISEGIPDVAPPTHQDLQNLYKESDDISHQIGELLRTNPQSIEIGQLKQRRSQIWSRIDNIESQIQNPKIDRVSNIASMDYSARNTTYSQNSFTSYQSNSFPSSNYNYNQNDFTSSQSNSFPTAYNQSSYNDYSSQLIDEPSNSSPRIYEKPPVTASAKYLHYNYSPDETFEEITETFVPSSTTSIDPNVLEKITSVNQNVFHHRQFRGVQASAIDAALKGEDVFVLMPTGGGKSLCYQLPGYIQQKLTIVVSPLIALIEDQVRGLRALGISVEFLSADTGQKKYFEVTNNLRQGNILFLYITPEKLTQSQHLFGIITELYHKNMICRFAIDEAHCVSQWGHDFRPQYTQLNIIKSSFPNISIMALTATATPSVKADIIKELSIANCKIFQQSFNRPNLFYEVISKEGNFIKECETILNWIKSHNYENETGLIFCTKTKETERISDWLCNNGLQSLPYHAKLNTSVKTDNQRKWMSNQVKVIVATLAFGMGIDKEDVRYVIHHTMPKSLEEYYQESGRAGRDGKRSCCALMFKISDKSKVSKLIWQTTEYKAKQRLDIEMELLSSMTQYGIEKSICRRVNLLKYFGEDFNPNDCHGMCDNCLSKIEGRNNSINLIDVTQHAKNIASLVNNIKRRSAPHPTVSYIVSVYTGSKSQKIVKAGDDKLPEHGMGTCFKGINQDIVHRIIRVLLEKEILEEGNRHSAHGPIVYLRAGKNIGLIRSNEFPKVMVENVNNTSKLRHPENDSQNGVSVSNDNTYKELLNIRQRIADQIGADPNSIVSTDALKQMAAINPKNIKELENINGLTKTQIARYGDCFCEYIRGLNGQETVQGSSPYFGNKSTNRKAQPQMPPPQLTIAPQQQQQQRPRPPPPPPPPIQQQQMQQKPKEETDLMNKIQNLLTSNDVAKALAEQLKPLLMKM
ncbi:ATP-dependent DNA helicase, RecQ family protein [Histomonas meleagridis]|uniref:ATP-dependent DNA helicase, RecQ family protein n=1 Tax=Histomonas meleagridis TaxID=135588 RepID=UPI003559895C|nr:ATP-dependent DNA helicase, RecQ family protein [Histomonas meleagridis]KAH0804303.1 ATP-dependent DNA helicase, RecQ family protein [Histomonas meleagridis]